MGEEARILRFAEGRRMPWRNRGGETIEIVAHPPGSGLGAFDWRVSLARIDRDGPFSAFPAVDRVFAVLDGAGVELEVGAGPSIRLAQATAPRAFPGEAPCRCRLVDGPVTALNVMVARGAFACAVTRLDPRRGPSMTDAAVTIVVCAEGTIATSLGVAGPRDVILIPPGASVRVGPGASPTRGFVAAFEPVPGTHGP